MGLVSLFRKHVLGEGADTTGVYVIESPLFSRKNRREKGAEPVIQYAQMVARRGHFDGPWSIEKSFWKEQAHPDAGSISGWDYQYPKTESVRTTLELKKAFESFRLECLNDGMSERRLTHSTYTNGILSHKL